MSARVLNRRQARWSMSLSRFDFKITYRPGSQQGKSDALSRRSYFAPKAGEAAFYQQQTILLKPEQFHLQALQATSAVIDSSLLDQVRANMPADPLALDPGNLVRKHNRSVDVDNLQDDIGRFQFKDGLLYYEGLLYIPKGPTRFQILEARHDFPAAGHFGFNKTIELAS